MKDKVKLFYLVLFVLALIVNFAGINVNFFTDDPGLYAAIAKNLIYKKDLLQLFTYNQDWLDKPHFPFWMVYFSFKIFGVSIWAYRLPALLFFMLSLLYIWLFTRKFHSEEIAIIAVLIVMTAQYTLMGNTDVRAEPYLMGLVIGSIYHISRLEERFSPAQLFLAALLTACAIMTKGIFVITAIYGSLLGQLIFQKKLGQLFSPKFIALYLLTLIFTLPEFYALYIQFDFHPEKTVFDRHNVSGIKWFLWDSQFGRFVNKGPISQKSGGDVFFYVHTLLWAFAPWCLLFYYALYKRVRQLFGKTTLKEYYTLSGGLLLLLLFSLSRFQLPFYTNAIFPLFAVIMAPFLYEPLRSFGTKFRLVSQWIYIILFPVVIVVVNYFLKPDNSLLFLIDCIAFVLLVIAIVTQIKPAHQKIFLLNCSVALFANFYLTTVLYREVAAYNGQITAARYINQPIFSSSHLYSLKPQNNVFQFYVNKPVDYIPLEQFGTFKSSGNEIFYANQASINYLTQTHAGFKIIQSFTNYPQERILPDFINKPNRFKVLDKVYLISK
jgi:4-amino-4-deoxy-L-arabinose transferase-like glycosyltransferase